MKRRNKRILAVVLAVVMAFGLASTAFAVEPPAAEIEEVVGTVYPQTPIWFSDADFVYEEGVPMPIGNDVLTGRNTVQKIATFGHEYYLVIHPQYFHNVPNPASDNYDDPDDAIAMFTIVDLLVYSPQEDEYVTCLNGNLAAFSDEYLQFNGDGDPYFQFIVALKYVDIANESV
ncbi:MAG: hypothetical protein LBD92_06210, partial [Oscillospiraceae bacterium]|nr:hypothetical protein [Oscillospiraceae bacterium]